MKKFLMLISAIFLVGLITACGGNEGASGESINIPKTEKKEPSQEELNNQLKEAAIEANFVELNSNETEQGKKVFATGKVSFIAEDGIFKTFTLTTDEGDGKGMYTIVDVLKDVEYIDGDTLKIYGTFKGKNDLGIPEITSTIIEKQ